MSDETKKMIDACFNAKGNKLETASILHKRLKEMTDSEFLECFEDLTLHKKEKTFKVLLNFSYPFAGQ